jgi:hypothetical protein
VRLISKSLAVDGLTCSTSSVSDLVH